MVFHFRTVTTGEIDKLNCQPLRIRLDLGLAHDGILSCVTVPDHSEVSDTILFRDSFLGNLTGQSLHDITLFNTLSSHIGAGNKFAFMNGDGTTVICNEEHGMWENGLWFSNSSFKTRKNGQRYNAENGKRTFLPG